MPHYICGPNHSSRKRHIFCSHTVYRRPCLLLLSTTLCHMHLHITLSLHLEAPSLKYPPQYDTYALDALAQLTLAISVPSNEEVHDPCFLASATIRSAYTIRHPRKWDLPHASNAALADTGHGTHVIHMQVPIKLGANCYYGPKSLPYGSY